MSLTKLMRFASGDPQEWHKEPFLVKIKRTSWSGATDGVMMFAFKKKVQAEVPKDHPEEVLLDLLSHEPSRSTMVPVAKLKEWAGKAPRKRIPKDQDVYLEDCGNLMGVAVDRRKLAFLLAKVNIPSVHAWVKNEYVIVFEPPNGQWRAFLAGYKDKPEPELVVFDPDQETPSAVNEDLMDLMEEADQG